MKEIYQHLRSYGLTRQGRVYQRLTKFSEHRVSEFLEIYLDIAQNRRFVLAAEAGATDIYPDSAELQMPLDIIRRLSLYANRIYVHDPLIPMAFGWRNLDFTPYLTIKFPAHDDRVQCFLARLASEVESLLEIRPLVDAGIIHFSPSELLQYSKDPQALYADDIYGPKGSLMNVLEPAKGQPELPPMVLEYCNHNLITFPASYVNDEPTMHTAEISSPRDMIAIKFRGDPIPKFYQYHPMQLLDDPVSGQKRWITYFNIDERSSIDPLTFHHWEQGSRRESILERIDRLYKDLYLANIAEAKFTTSLPASKDLAQLSLDFDVEQKRSNITTALMQIDVPHFEGADFSKIAEARRNELAFEEFRRALEEAFKEIDALPYTTEYQARVDEVTRDLLIVPLARVNKEMQTLKRNLVIDAGIIVGVLTATFVSGGKTLLTAAAIAAVAAAVKMYKDEKTREDEIKQTPSFFYWQVTQNKK